MFSRQHRTPRPNHRNRTSLALGALLLALGGTQVACVVHSHPVYVVDPAPPPPPPVTAVVVEEGADATVVVEDFYEPLSYYGVWVYVPGYGRVWQPAADMAGPEFVPYASHGRWVLNADGDWVFVSRYDTQWGWATYHYGRWMWTDYYGWVWIPGRAWAPAWVEWRYGGGYVGWVPLGPPGYVIVEHHWVFVERAYISSPAVATYRLPPERARTAYVAATPVLEVKGDSKWKAGPPPHEIRDAGIEIGSVQGARPGAGFVKTQGRLAIEGGAERKAAGLMAYEPHVRPGTTVAPGAGVVGPGREPPPPDSARPDSQPGVPSQPGMPSQPGVTPRPGATPQPGMPTQPGVTPQPGPEVRPQPVPQPSIEPRPQPQPVPQPTVQPRPQPVPQPTVQPRPTPTPRPTVQPRPTPAPTVAPKPTTRPSTPAPRPAPKRRK